MIDLPSSDQRPPQAYPVVLICLGDPPFAGMTLICPWPPRPSLPNRMDRPSGDQRGSNDGRLLTRVRTGPPADGTA